MGGNRLAQSDELRVVGAGQLGSTSIHSGRLRSESRPGYGVVFVNDSKVLAVACKVPAPFRVSAMRLAFAWLRQTQCSRGIHGIGANYCTYGCREQLVKDAWREWTVALADGSIIKVNATNERHARNLVVYGEATPGQVDLYALVERRARVHKRNIVSCTAGQATQRP